jgi:hypothetical protein
MAFEGSRRKLSLARCLHWLMASLLLAACAMQGCRADSWAYCDRHITEMSGAEADQMMAFGAQINEFLQQSGASAVIISRSGFDLSRFGLHYSHAGIALPDSDKKTWRVRQLYFDCDEERPRIYDQGILGFLAGNEPKKPAFLSVVFLPQEKEAALRDAAKDNQVALSLLSSTYSANAYAFSTLYQNCNQWVAEMLGFAWKSPAAVDLAESPRQQAQTWLKSENYQPTDIPVQRWMIWLSPFAPRMHRDDHPAEDLARRVLRVSMPGSLEQFVHAQVPGASRVEFCMKDGKVITRHGWALLPADCHAETGDQVEALP